VVYYSNTRQLQLEKTGTTTRVLLTECDRWDFKLFTRAPNVTSTNIVFNPTQDLNACKLIDMSWKCSRTILGQPVNTESVQTAKVVLRNKIT
jgi:hypothetical protein